MLNESCIHIINLTLLTVLMYYHLTILLVPFTSIWWRILHIWRLLFISFLVMLLSGLGIRVILVLQNWL